MTSVRDKAEVIPSVVADRDAKSRLLKAAVLLFRDRGYGGVSIREIAAAARRNSSLISFYFGGKAGIHQAALSLACSQVQGLATSFPALPGEDEPDARRRAEAALGETIRTFLRFAAPPPPPADEEGAFAHALIMLFLRELATPVPETETLVLDAVRPHAEYMNRCIQTLRPDLDARSALAIGMGIHGQLLFFLTCKVGVPGFAKDLAEPVTDFVLRGLRTSDTFQG